MKKPIHVATALLVIALSGGPAAAADDVTDGASALVRPSLVERGWVGRGEASVEVPAVVTAAPSTCSDLQWTAKQPINDDEMSFAVVSELGGAEHGQAAEGRVVASVLTPLGAGAVEQLKWWGISDQWNPGGNPEDLQQYCNTDDAANRPFRIVFYANDGGLPGNIVAVRNSNTPADVLTDLDWDPRAGASFQHFVAEYTANFGSPIDATNVVWFSIQRHAGPTINGDNECVFAWINETSLLYDDLYVFDLDRQDTGDDAADLTYCLAQGAPAGSYIDIFHGDFERGDFRYWSDTLQQ